MTGKTFKACLLLSAVFLLPTAASAQMSNKPYSFGTPGQGAGMSVAGKQAIMNQKLYGSTPDVLLKSPDGRLLGVSKAPGELAIVTTPGGEIVPSYRGRSITADTGWQAGAFNPYFFGSRDNGVSFDVSVSSTDTVSAWTNQVFGGSSASSRSSVDVWTDMVYW